MARGCGVTTVCRTTPPPRSSLQALTSGAAVTEIIFCEVTLYTTCAKCTQSHAAAQQFTQQLSRAPDTAQQLAE
jgi:hypothetical protein